MSLDDTRTSNHLEIRGAYQAVPVSKGGDSSNSNNSNNINNRVRDSQIIHSSHYILSTRDAQIQKKFHNTFISVKSMSRDAHK